MQGLPCPNCSGDMVGHSELQRPVSVSFNTVFNSDINTVVIMCLKPGSGRGGPDPAFQPLFYANLASRAFFISFPNPAFLSQKNALKSLI